MSGTQGDGTRNTNGGPGIRLPPISFLSGVLAHQPLAQPTDSLLQETHDFQPSKNGVFYGNGHENHRASLPGTQSLNHFPNQSPESLKNQQNGIHVPDSVPENNAAMGHFQTIVHGNKAAQHRALSRATKLAEARLEHRKKQKKKAYSRIYDRLSRDFPIRRHLGTLVYNPTTTWETLQFEQMHGLLAHDMERFHATRAEFLRRKTETADAEAKKYIPVIPPLSGAYINNFLEVKVSYKHIKGFLDTRAQGIVERKRELWGGAAGIYTDDSDLLYVLCHLGLFDGNLDLSESNCKWTSTDFTRPAFTQKDADGVELLDLSVTLLLLPSLNQYRGFYRNGINSRTWSDKPAHSGLSFAVYNVKWETFILSMGERTLSKKARKEYVEDQAANTQIRAQKNGWTFDPSLLQDLKQKSDKVFAYVQSQTGSLFRE